MGKKEIGSDLGDRDFSLMLREELNHSAAQCPFPRSSADAARFHIYGFLSYYYGRGDNDRPSWPWLAVEWALCGPEHLLMSSGSTWNSLYLLGPAGPL